MGVHTAATLSAQVQAGTHTAKQRTDWWRGAFWGFELVLLVYVTARCKGFEQADVLPCPVISLRVVSADSCVTDLCVSPRRATKLRSPTRLQSMFSQPATKTQDAT
jgi:hypothetical protein